MNKITRKQAEELYQMVDKGNTTIDQYKDKAKELGIDIPKHITDAMKKQEKRDKELKDNNKMYESSEYDKQGDELYGKDRMSGIYGEFVNWICNLTE